MNEWKLQSKESTWEGPRQALTELSFEGCRLRFVGELHNQSSLTSAVSERMEWNRIGNTPARGIQFCEISVLDTHPGLQCKICFLLEKKKKKEELCLPGATKAVSQVQGRTSWVGISGILHFERVSLGISVYCKLWSLQSGNQCRVWSFRQFNSHERADQITPTVFGWLSSVWKGKWGRWDQGRRSGPTNTMQSPLSTY